MNRQQTAVAAEAFAAGVFAQAGYSVFVQYGANQPGYDFAVISDDRKAMQVSVKGSTDGWWLLTAKEKGKTYQQAYEEWIKKNRGLVFCLVQFNGVRAGDMPRMYLATGEEIGQILLTFNFGELNLALTEHYTPTKGKNKGKEMAIPAIWRMTKDRIDLIVNKTINASAFAAAVP